MKDEKKTKAELIKELAQLRQRLSQLEAPETGRKQEEESLRESAEWYRLVAENSDDLIAVTTLDGKYTYASPSHRKYGYEPANLIGKMGSEIVHPDDRERLFSKFVQFLTRRLKERPGDRPERFAANIAYRIRDASGNWHHIETVSSYVTTGRPGEEPSLLHIARDITGKKLAEEALRRSEDRFHAMVEDASDGFAIIGDDGAITYSATSNERMLGYEPGERPPTTIINSVHPDDQSRIMTDFAQLWDNPGSGFSSSYRVQHKDGSWRTVGVIAKSRIDDPVIQGIIVNFRDITERTQSEEALRASERKFKELVELLPQAIFEMGGGGTVTFINPFGLHAMGYTAEDVAAGFNAFDLIAPEDRGRCVENVASILKGEVSGGKEYDVISKDGERFPVIIYSAPIYRNDEAIGVRGVVVDIGERKRQQEALKQSEENFRTMFENINDAIAYVDDQGIAIDVNNRLVDLFGYSEDEVVGKPIFETPFTTPETMQEVMTAFAEAISGTVRQFFAFEGRKRDGTPVYVEASTRQIAREGGAVGFMTILRDITERKRFEEALRQSEQKYRELIESTIDGLFVIDAETLTVVFGNNTAARMFGLTSIEEGIGLNPLDFVHPDERDHAARVVMEDMFEKDLHRIEEFRAIARDGKEIWIESVGTRTQYEGKLAGLISVRDITERKQAERVIRIQHNLAQALSTVSRMDEGLNVCLEAALLASQLDGAGILLFEEQSGALVMAHHKGLSEEFVSATTRYEADSPSLQIVMRGSPLYTRHQDLEIPLDEPRIREGLKALAVIPLHYEDRVIGCLNAASRTLEQVPSYARDALETIAAQVGPAIASLRAGEALRQSELRFRTIFENANDEIIHLDRFGTIVDRNQKSLDLLGYPLDEVIGRSFAELPGTLPEGQMQKMADLFFNAMGGTGGRGLTELEMIHKNGSPVFVEASISRLMKEDQIDGVLIILRDITERKRTQEQMIRHNRQLAALAEIADTINQSIDLDGILSNTLDKTLQILDIRHGSVHTVDKDHECLTLRIHRGMSPERIQAYSTIRLGEGYVGRVPEFGEPVFVEDLGESAESSEGIALIQDENLKSAMFVPLKSKGELLGIMTAVTEGHRTFTTEERDLLAIVGHQVSTAIENAQLVQDASRAKALEELDRLRTALLASVSHELRTPLTSIKGLASSLTQPDIKWDAQTQMDFLKIIDRESDVLTHIVNDLMEMSQIEAGLMRMIMKRTSISAVIGQLSERLASLTGNHQLEINAPKNLGAITADDIRLGEVITNLVSNAVAYSETGTKIIIDAKANDGDVVVSVADEGIGIASDHLEKVFDRFYRLESGVSRRRGGTGLGLSICRSIMEQHGGRIWAESRLGQGSRFYFSLPSEVKSRAKPA